MLIGGVMSQKVITISPGATLREAAKILAERDIGGLPVVDGAGQLVGIISESDIIHRREAGSSLNHWIELESFLRIPTAKRELSEDVERHLDSTVEESMTRRVVTIGLETPLRKAAQLMVEHRINRLPVLDRGHLIGIVTRGDILKAMYSEQRGT